MKRNGNIMKKIIEKIIALLEENKYLEIKPFYYSKTLWINALALIALIAQLRYGFIFSIEEQAALITVINLVLRIFTKKELIK